MQLNSMKIAKVETKAFAGYKEIVLFTCIFFSSEDKIVTLL